MMGVLGRDGHLTDLAIDRALYDSADPYVCDVHDHAARCAPCAARLDAVTQWGAEVRQTARSSGSTRSAFVVPWWGWNLAMAASLALFLWPGEPTAPPEPDVLHTRGSGFELEAWLDQPGADRQLTTGDSIDAGARIGLRVRGGQGGFLTVIGRDRRAPWPVVEAIEVPPIDPWTVPRSVRLVDPGTERLIALLCPTRVGYDRAVAAFESGLPDRLGCAWEDITLHTGPK